MYVFTSAIFFIIFFSFIVKPEEIGETVAKKSEAGLDQVKQSLQDSITTATDSAKRAGFVTAFNALDKVSFKETDKGKVEVVKKDTSHKPSTKPNTPGEISHYKGKIDTAKKTKVAVANATIIKTDNDSNDDAPDFNKPGAWDVHITDEKLPPTIEIYDSLQKKLPQQKRDGWVKRIINHRSIEIKQKYHGITRNFKKPTGKIFAHHTANDVCIAAVCGTYTAVTLCAQAQTVFLCKPRNIYYLCVHSCVCVTVGFFWVEWVV